VRPPRGFVLGLSGLAFVAGALAIVDASGRRAEGTFAAGSVFSEEPEGLSLAFRYLSERSAGEEAGRPEVSVLSRRLGVGSLPADGVLFRWRPRRTPFPPSREDLEKKSSEEEDSEEEDHEGEGPEVESSSEDTPSPETPERLLTGREEAWVRNGGRLVLGLDSGYGPLGIRRNVRGGPVRKVFPLWPGVAVLEPGAKKRSITDGPAEEAHAVFVQGSSALVSRLVVGRGEVLLLAAPELVENERLAAADHLGLLEALAGSGRPVAFDEWTHGLGQDETLLELMLEWGLGPTLVVGALAFVLVLWRRRTRVGPEEDDTTEERSEAVDLVDSLAQLYDRALSRREAAALHLQGFRKAVALRTGLKGAALERRARELLGGTGDLPAGVREIPASAFLGTLTAVNAAYRRLDEHAHSRRRP
jgi:hypothetical protein